MKIQSINNTNFKGIFKDASSRNNGDWRMEYYPYSWEKKSHSEFGMSHQKEWDIFAKELPDNEKRYIDATYESKSYPHSIKGRQFCKDILGTEFYSQDYDTGKMRRTITEMPAMNREDSLKVQNTKLEKFLQLKDALIKEKLDAAKSASKDIQKNHSVFYDRVNDAKQFFLFRSTPVDDSIDIMSKEYTTLKNAAVTTQNAFKDYVALNQTKEVVKEQLKNNKKELGFIEILKQGDKLIDISKRDVYDPNRALWVALQDIKDAAAKYVSLPHRTISIKELLEAVGKNVKSADIPAEVIKFVDKLIATKI